MPEFDEPREFDLTIRIMGGQAIAITAPGDMVLKDLVDEFMALRRNVNG
jgi:hypothetical protein